MCISFTFCLFPVEEGSKTFGDLGEFNSMRTGGVTVFFFGCGWAANFVRGKGLVHQYMPGDWSLNKT